LSLADCVAELLLTSLFARIEQTAHLVTNFLVLVAKFAPGAYSESMSSQRLEDLRTGLIKDFEAHKSHIPHQGLLRCSLCDMYQKELLRLEAAERGR
jgi:hypothetical protein